MTELRFFVGLKWGGGQKRLYLDTGIGEPMISQVMSETKKAGLKNKLKIAKAYGFLHDVFLELGRSLIETGQPPPKKPESHQPPQPSIDYNLIVQINSQTDKDRLNDISEVRSIPLYESGRLAAEVNGLIFDPDERPGINRDCLQTGTSGTRKT